MADRTIGCGDCSRPAAIVTVAQDARLTADKSTQAFCPRHFWTWNARSLEARGRTGASRAIMELVEQGEFDTPPPLPGREPEATPLRMLL